MDRGDLRVLACPREVRNTLDSSGYRFLGWLNDTSKMTTDDVDLIDRYDYVDLYSTVSGSYCIYANHEHKLYYCVDMGD